MASGHTAYVHGHSRDQVKHHAWRTAENSAEHLIPKLKSIAETNPTLQLLDVGAGSGTITASFAKYMPQGHITATDISDEILSQAREHAESKGVTNISFKYASVYELPFADASFDVVHAHQVLCHLDAPSDAIKEILRVVKPGGIVALRESDLRTWCFYPELPALLKFQDMLTTVHVAGGGDDKGGRKLVSWILSAGVARGDIEASMGTWCYAQEEDRKAWGEAMISRIKNGHVRVKGLEMGIVTQQDVDEMLSAWEEWMGQEDAMLGMVNGQAIISKR